MNQTDLLTIEQMTDLAEHISDLPLQQQAEAIDRAVSDLLSMLVQSQ